MLTFIKSFSITVFTCHGVYGHANTSLITYLLLYQINQMNTPLISIRQDAYASRRRSAYEFTVYLNLLSLASNRLPTFTTLSLHLSLRVRSPPLFVLSIAHNRRNSFTTHLGFMSQMPTEEKHQRSNLCNYGRPAYVPKP